MTGPARVAVRIYAWLLRAFPAAHRASYGREMTDAFARELLERRRNRGRLAALRFALAGCLDAVASGAGERRRSRRRQGGTHWTLPLQGAGRDLVYAVRSLGKARAFSLVCVVSLGVGMGVVMAIFVLMRGVFGAPPGVKPDGLVELIVEPQGALRAQTGGRDLDTWSYPDFADLREADTGMALTGWTVRTTLTRLGEGERLRRRATMYVSPNYFTTVGTVLLRGAGFAESRAARPAQPVVLVGYYLWLNELDADPDVLGRTITIDHVQHVVVGVGPRRFQGHNSPENGGGVDLWLPLDQHPRLVAQAEDSLRFDRQTDWLHVLGRLHPGATLARANAGVSAAMSALADEHPASNGLKAARVEPYLSMGALSRNDVRLAESMMFGLSGLVLVVVCLNVSGMVLVRSAARERELAIRMAIGAGRRRLMQSLLAEAVLLALLGGALATAVLFAGPAILMWWFGVRSSGDLDLLRPDRWVALYAVGLCFVTSLVFGLVPAIRFSRPTLVHALKDEAGGGGRRVGRVHRWTAAVQAGMAVPFLVFGAARLDSVRTTATADLGFEAQGLFALWVDLSAPGRPGDGAFSLRAIEDRLAGAAGVTSVTAADGLPLDFRRRMVRLFREERVVAAVHTTRVADGYFDAMRIPILRGRGITRDDRAGAALVAVISESLAARLFPDVGAIGQRVSFALADDTRRAATIVGVSGDVVTSQMGTERPQMFVPLAQHPATGVLVIARASATDEAMRAAFQKAMPDLDDEMVRANLVTGDWLVRRSMSDLMTHSALAGISAVVLLTLAGLGVYGVVGFMVASRTREIGVRIALGASRTRVLGAVTADAMRLVVPGAAIGLLGGIYWIRVVDPAWYPLGGVEPMVYAAALAVVLGVAALAGLPAARRAASVDPLRAMRAE